MTGGPRPEGLEELSKREEGFDREELQAIYAELYEEIEATSLDRRTLLANGHGRDRSYVGDTTLLESAVF